MKIIIKITNLASDVLVQNRTMSIITILIIRAQAIGM